MRHTPKKHRESATIRVLVGLTVAAYTSSAASAAQGRGTAYVASGNQLVIVDLTTNAITTRVDLPVSPQGFEQFVRITPDGARVYVARQDTNASCCGAQLAVLDTAANELLPPVAVGRALGITSGLGRIGFSPDSSTAYVPFLALPRIAVVDTRTNAVTSSISLSPDDIAGIAGFAVTRDGRFAYATAPIGPSQVAVIDLAQGQIATTIPLPPCNGISFSDDVAITPDGTRAYVPIFCLMSAAPTLSPAAVGASAQCFGACSGHQRVTVDDLVLGVAIGLGVSPATACQAFDRLVTVEALLAAVNNGVAGCSGPPTGSYAVAINTSTNQVAAIIDFGLASEQGLTIGGNGSGAAGPSGLSIAIAPDGKLAYVGSCDRSGTSICVIDTVQQSVRTVIPTAGFIFDVALGADGALLYATTNQGEVLVVDTATNAVVDSIEAPFSAGIAIRNESTALRTLIE